MKLHQEFAHGGFSPCGESFVIRTPETPRPWTNHLWNENFLSVFSQNGQGYSMKQDDRGRRTRMAKARMLYLIDQGCVHSIHGLPVDTEYDEFRCEHHMGYSRIVSRMKGLEFTWTCFVPQGASHETWIVGIENTGREVRDFSIVAGLDSAIGERQDITSTSGCWEEPLEALICSNVIRHGAWYHHATEGVREKGFFTASRRPDGYDCRRSALFGPYGSPENPRRLKQNPQLENCPAEFEHILLSMQFRFHLEPGEKESFCLAAGVWDDPEDLRLVRDGLGVDQAEAALEEVRISVGKANGGARIRTPEPAFDLFVNNWLKHQVQFNSAWARIYYNGFRDLCQDNGNLAFINPGQGKSRLAETLKRQYSSGYAPRGWCEDELIEQDYADSPVWIINAVHNLVMEEGHTGFLNQSVPFREGGEGSVYEHCRRAMDYLWEDRGEHGLSLIHGGDWNDMLNGAGNEGRGESVWLSLALLHALPLFADLASQMNRTVEYRKALERRDVLSGSIDLFGWDGEWYRRGFSDSGRPLGSVSEKEGRLYLNSQAWAVMAGVGKDGRARSALERAESLLGTRYGLATLTPPYRDFDPEIGYISLVRPGTNTNGGIYIHSNAFKVLADCLLKRGDAAWESLARILPFADNRIPVSGPPYSLPNSYLGPESGYRFGDYGGPWITGTAGWIHTVVMNYIFGIRPVRDGLLVDPCFPSGWREAEIRRPFRGADYRITFALDGGQSDGGEASWKISVNGRPHEGRILPCRAGETYDVLVEQTKGPAAG